MEQDNGWKARWIRRDRTGMPETYEIVAVIAVVVAAIVLKSMLPILISFTAVAVYRAVVESKEDDGERKGTTSAP